MLSLFGQPIFSRRPSTLLRLVGRIASWTDFRLLGVTSNQVFRFHNLQGSMAMTWLPTACATFSFADYFHPFYRCDNGFPNPPMPCACCPTSLISTFSTSNIYGTIVTKANTSGLAVNLQHTTTCCCHTACKSHYVCALMIV